MDNGQLYKRHLVEEYRGATRADNTEGSTGTEENQDKPG